MVPDQTADGVARLIAEWCRTKAGDGVGRLSAARLEGGRNRRRR